MITPSGVSKSKAFGKIKVSEMNETSITQMSTGSGISSCETRRALTFFEHNDARIVADFQASLAMADIDRVNLGGTSLQQTIREPAGRRADVEGESVRSRRS